MGGPTKSICISRLCVKSDNADCTIMIYVVNAKFSERFQYSMFHSVSVSSYTFWWSEGILSYLPVPYDEGISSLSVNKCKIVFTIQYTVYVPLGVLISLSVCPVVSTEQIQLLSL